MKIKIRQNNTEGLSLNHQVLGAWFLLAFLLCGGCAYRAGSPERVLPGGYRSVSVPVFKNITQEPGAEVYFANALIDQLAKGQEAQVVQDNSAPVMIVGVIESVQMEARGKKTTNDIASLPEGAVLATEYRMWVVTRISFVEKETQRLIWSGQFRGERVFAGASVTAAVVNTVNPLYNHSAKHRNMAELATDMMTEAYDRLTENF